MMAQISASRILIASNDKNESSHLEELLVAWGHTVEVLRDGHLVLRRLGEPQPPEIALLDANLPELGGIEVVQELRQRSVRGPVWTMVMCDSPSCDHVLAATDAGVDDFLAKPLDELDLRIRLHAARRVRVLRARLNQSLVDDRYHASHDSLTGLWNREAMLRLLFQETDRVQRMRTPLALMLLDVDQFSHLNLDYGYAAGDRVLQLVAERFRRYLRSYDLIGRCGEDEFLVALPGCALELAAQQAERLRQTVLHRPFEVPGATINMTASIGVAQSQGRSPLIVLREAERALAEAKLQGRDRVCVFRSHEALQAVADQAASLSILVPKIPVGIAADRQPVNSCRLRGKDAVRSALSDGRP
jgi:two-component system cell cycle response regulator